MANTIFIILSLGILPTILWLWFWLREDYKRPEPRGLLVLGFFAGALSILVVLYFEKLAARHIASGLLLIIVWAFIEEIIKLGSAYFTTLRSKYFDEPLDAMVYLITVALGFAAFENSLFLIKTLSTDANLGVTIATAGMRFIGATLLHTLSSAVIGGMIALAYYKTWGYKVLYTIIGVLLATLLHTLFNFIIINQGLLGVEMGVVGVFFVLWISIIILILFFERIKTVIYQA